MLLFASHVASISITKSTAEMQLRKACTQTTQRLIVVTSSRYKVDFFDTM